MFRTRTALAAVAALVLAAGAVRAEEKKSALDSLKSGDPDIKSAGALAFGPEGILFVGDTQGAAVFALDTGDRTQGKGPGPKVEKIDGKIASLLGIEPAQLLVNDLAVNPISGNAYLSLSRGKGPDAKPAIVRVDREGKLSELSLKGIKFAKAELPNPAQGGGRKDSITCIAFTKDRVFVAGLSNEEFASKLRSIPFPFAAADKGTSVEIYHGNHGQFETRSPVRTFVPYDIKGEANILAAYTCTPLVKFPVSDLKPGEKVKGTTIAEMGNQNVPLDMIVYKKGDKEYILIANNKRGVMKMPTEGIDKAEAITKRVGGTGGMKYETVASLKDVLQLASFDAEHALVLVKAGDNLNLETIELP
jgi:hypothetical protein